jgi:phenylacetate-CoA ligase
VVAESYIVEIIKDGKPAQPGEMGEVVITDLNNYSMPFIRYRVGDLARAIEGPCPCGRGLPRIGEIEGRTQSIIVGTRKQYVPGSFFLHFLKDYDYALRQFQIEQTEPEKLVFRIVKTNRFNEDILSNILSTMQETVGPDMNIEVEYVDSIPLSRTGKVQVALSRLKLDFQNLK